MDIRFSGKNLNVSEGMKNHAREKVAKLERYAPRIVGTHVILRKEKYFYEAEMTLLAKNLKAFGEGKSKDNVYVAMDQAYARIEKQLKKYRERVKDHHKGLTQTAVPKSRKKRAVQEASLSAAKPAIIKASSFAVKPMTPDEASMQLELTIDPFLVFYNSATQQVNVLYKRDDGNHGLIEPEF